MYIPYEIEPSLICIFSSNNFPSIQIILKQIKLLELTLTNYKVHDKKKSFDDEYILKLKAHRNKTLFV